MGNKLIKILNHDYECQNCGNIFVREISGSLLCHQCRISNSLSSDKQKSIQNITSNKEYNSIRCA